MLALVRRLKLHSVKAFLLCISAVLVLATVFNNATVSTLFNVSNDVGFKQNTSIPQIIKRPRFAAILAVTPHINYLFPLPVAVAAWKKLGVEPIVIVVGSQEKLKNHQKLTVTIELLAELGAKIHFIQNETTPASTLSQAARLFASAMPFSNEYNDDDIFITTDADTVPFHLKHHIPNLVAAQKVYMYNADCAGRKEVPPLRGNYTVPMFPMSTIATHVSTWREIMGFTSADYNVTNIESYLKAEFGQNFFNPNDGEKNDLLKQKLKWFVDQILISYKIDEWFKANPNNRAATTLTRGGCHPRIDRIKWPKEKDMATLDLNLLGDAHVLEQGYADGQWERFRPMIELVFKGNEYALLRKRFDQYRSDYVSQLETS